MDFTLFGWSIGLHWWAGTPCHGDLWCWHIEGEPGHEGYEFMLAVTATRVIHFSADPIANFSKPTAAKNQREGEK